jgi:TatD DNase family protein
VSARSRDAGRTGEPPPPPEPLAVPVLDSHAHLDLMDADVDEALEAARSVGIDTVVQVGVDLPSSRWSADVAARYDAVHAAVALHPNEAALGAATDEALREVEQLAALPRSRRWGRPGWTSSAPPSPRAAAAGGVLPGAHRHRQGDRHDAGHPRPRRPRRRGAGAAGRGAPGAGGLPLLLRRSGPRRTCAEHGWWASFAGPVTFKANDDLRPRSLRRRSSCCWSRPTRRS